MTGHIAKLFNSLTAGYDLAVTTTDAEGTGSRTLVLTGLGPA